MGNSNSHQREDEVNWHNPLEGAEDDPNGTKIIPGTVPEEDKTGSMKGQTKDEMMQELATAIESEWNELEAQPHLANIPIIRRVAALIFSKREEPAFAKLLERAAVFVRKDIQTFMDAYKRLDDHLDADPVDELYELEKFVRKLESIPHAEAPEARKAWEKARMLVLPREIHLVSDAYIQKNRDIFTERMTRLLSSLPKLPEGNTQEELQLLASVFTHAMQEADRFITEENWQQAENELTKAKEILPKIQGKNLQYRFKGAEENAFDFIRRQITGMKKRAGISDAKEQ